MRPALLPLLVAPGCTGAPARPTLRVLAAASLVDAFSELETLFEGSHAGADVELVFAGSQVLAGQIRHGLDADLLASADARTADQLAAEGWLEPATVFASGALVVAVSAHSPAAGTITELRDLDHAERLVLGTPEVPVGRYADDLLDAAGARYGPGWLHAVRARVVSREPDARKVAAKVALGEADAAIVYRTDLRGLDGVRAVPIPHGDGPTPTYVLGRLAAGGEPTLAAEWLRLVRSDDGRRALSRHGFTPAPP